MDNEIDIKIKIGRTDFYIGCDKYNFILGQKGWKVNKHKGEDLPEIFTFIGKTCSYYKSLEHLMEDLQVRLIKNKKAQTIEQLMENIAKANKEVRELYKTIKEDEL